MWTEKTISLEVKVREGKEQQQKDMASAKRRITILYCITLQIPFFQNIK
jgi:hypothetical protein